MNHPPLTSFRGYVWAKTAEPGNTGESRCGLRLLAPSKGKVAVWTWLALISVSVADVPAPILHSFPAVCLAENVGVGAARFFESIGQRRPGSGQGDQRPSVPGWHISRRSKGFLAVANQQKIVMPSPGPTS